ncbi:MAG TPA: DNA polymerase III subunit delta', partial [Thermohalobaculum sp.]|nr:DNA polymerase III subunit delta' [Thermohalobaculum sp.]
MAAEAAPPEPDRVPGYPHPRETPRLFGQEAAEAAFLAAWAEDRLHHAWLISGPRGIGKATLAYRMARALIVGGPTGDAGLFGDPAPPPASLDAPAGDPVQARIAAGAEPRLMVLRRTLNDRGALRTVIRVEEVRRVREFLGLSAADGGWRAVIVDAADEMNVNAANALLKVLEEPPPLTVLLLVAHGPARLLPTIRSRCRTLALAPLGPQALADALEQAGAPVAPGHAAALAILSGGSAGAALRL